MERSESTDHVSLTKTTNLDKSLNNEELLNENKQLKLEILKLSKVLEELKENQKSVSNIHTRNRFQVLEDTT